MAFIFVQKNPFQLPPPLCPRYSLVRKKCGPNGRCALDKGGGVLWMKYYKVINLCLWGCLIISRKMPWPYWQQLVAIGHPNHLWAIGFALAPLMPELLAPFVPGHHTQRHGTSNQSSKVEVLAVHTLCFLRSKRRVKHSDFFSSFDTIPMNFRWGSDLFKHALRWPILIELKTTKDT